MLHRKLWLSCEERSVGYSDDQGRITESTELRSDGDIRMLNVEKDRWHSLECLESGSVLYESKDGPYHPLEEDEIMVK